MEEAWAILAAIAVLALPVVLFGAIFRKAGYSGWLGLLMLIPLVNLLWLITFAASEWPIQRELSRWRSASGDAPAEDAVVALSEAARLEQRGEWEQAAAVYERIACLSNNPNAEYAANSAARVRDRLAQNRS